MTVQLLRIDEAAARLGVHRSHVYRLINTGQLRKTHIGTRGTRIPEDAIAELVARNSNGIKPSRRAS